MPTPDFQAYEVGGVLFPLAQPSSNTLLRDADPTVFFSLDFITAMLVQHIGARFVAACSAAGIMATTGIAITSPVMTQAPYDVSPYLGTVQYKFPVLAISRKQFRTEWKEFGFERDLSAIAIQWVLPTLTAAQAEAIIPIISAAYKVIRERVSAGADPSYTPPGGTLGDNPWHIPYANAEEMGIAGARVGELEGEGNLHFPCLLLDGTFYERDNPPPATGIAKFTGVDAVIGQLTDDGISTLETPAQVIGTADVTQETLYGATGTLNGLTLTLTVNGTAHTLTLNGSTNTATNATLLAAIASTWANLTAYSGGQNGWLVLVDAILGTSSIIVVGSGTANAALGLTPGTTIGAAGIAPIVQLSTNQAPTITGVSPNNGTQAGGTAVTITGTGFSTTWKMPGGVLFGTLKATNIVVVSSTSITCVTPASSGNGTCSVSVFNGDGQVADSLAAYTYTTP